VVPFTALCNWIKEFRSIIIIIIIIKTIFDKVTKDRRTGVLTQSELAGGKPTPFVVSGDGVTSST
jgi:hypothetical protein